MRTSKLRFTRIAGLTAGILATMIFSGPSKGTARSDMAVSLTSYRAQWDSFEAFLSRVYGQKWSTARLSDKAATLVSWHTDLDAKIRTTEAEIADATRSQESESTSIKIDQAILITPRSQWQGDRVALNNEINAHNEENKRCVAAVAQHNANNPRTNDAGVAAKYNQEAAELRAWQKRIADRIPGFDKRNREMDDRLAGLDRRQAAIRERESALAKKQSDLEVKKTGVAADCDTASEKIRAGLEELTRMNERAADNIHALELASRNFTRPGHPAKGLALGPAAQRKLEENNCRHYFLQMGEQIAKSYPQAKGWSADFGQLASADAVVRKLEKLSSGPGSEWTKVSAESDAVLWAKLQEMANSGAVVIGGSKASAPGAHGHLGFVSPTPAGFDPKAIPGIGPFVRDGNEHDFRQNSKVSEADRKVYPSTYGAIKASKAFPLQQTSWYVWKPSTP